MKKAHLLIASLVIAAGTAHAQLNFMNAVKSAQGLAQQAGIASPGGSNSQQGSAPATGAGSSSAPPYGEYEAPLQQRIYGNINFETYFKCSQKSTPPIESSIALHGITLGDVCGLPNDVLSMNYSANNFHGQLRGFLIQSSVSTLQDASQANNASVGAISMGNEQGRVTINLFTSRAQAEGLPRAVVGSVQATVCAADASNSLQPGNSFRSALEQRYGKPSASLDVPSFIRAQDQASKRASSQPSDISAAFQDADIRSNMVMRNWASLMPAGTIAEVDWRTTDGTKLLVTRSPDGCGNVPAFDMTLMPDNGAAKESQFLMRQWIEPMAAFQKSAAESRSATAAAPKF